MGVWLGILQGRGGGGPCSDSSRRGGDTLVTGSLVVEYMPLASYQYHDLTPDGLLDNANACDHMNSRGKLSYLCDSNDNLSRVSVNGDLQQYHTG